MTPRVWSVGILSITLAAPLLALAVACDSGEVGHAAATKLCTPGANVFCNCVGGKESGTKQCLASGQAFGACEPCLGASPVEDTEQTTDEDVSTRQVDTAVAGGGDKCPGNSANLDSANELVLDGDTSVLKADFAGTGLCKNTGTAKDAVHELVATDRGRITFTLTPGSGFDGTLYVRRGTCEGGEQIGCSEAGAAGGVEKIQVFAEAGEKLYAIVDGKDTAAGSYSLTVTQEPGTFCGDNTLNPGEICEDGNQIAGDGCSATCVPDGKMAAAATCPGLTLHVWSEPFELKASTGAFANTQKSSCGGSGARDAVFAVVAHRSGVLHADIKTATFDVVMYTRSDACATGKETACASLVKGKGAEKLTAPVKSGETVYLFVDGFKYEFGDFTLALAIE